MMQEPLWTLDALLGATAGRLDGASPPSVTGVSIDSRSLRAGDIFVAITDKRDGHDFVADAFRAGAVAAIVAPAYRRKRGDGALVRVDDPLRALERLGAAARTRLSPEARVIAVTGSAGKTGTKEMLRLCLARLGRTHASEKSYNNHWGVPLTLARMPADTQYAVVEIGMNHAGEIRPLSRLARPHAAIVTTVAPVHLEFFPSVQAIAEAKAEIFDGLEPGGAAILNCGTEHHWLLTHRARAAGATIIGVGTDQGPDVQLVHVEAKAAGSTVRLAIDGKEEPLFFELGAPGGHLAMNAALALAAIRAVGGNLDVAKHGLASFEPPPGRGARRVLAAPGGTVLVIDESYNANPASMGAALDAMASVPRSDFPRRIAVIGDMLELGDQAAALHEALTEPIRRAGVDLVFACGPRMKGLFEVLPSRCQGAWAESSDGLRQPLFAAVKAGDVIMIKGSLGSRMAPLVEALDARFTTAGARG